MGYGRFEYDENRLLAVTQKVLGLRTGQQTT
jgi:hypothetical protein